VKEIFLFRVLSALSPYMLPEDVLRIFDTIIEVLFEKLINKEA